MKLQPNDKLCTSILHSFFQSRMELITASKLLIPFTPAGLPKHSFPPRWAQHLHVAGTIAETCALSVKCVMCTSDLSCQTSQGLEKGMWAWWDWGNKKTELSILTVPWRWSALTRSWIAPSQEQISLLGGQGRNSKILVELKNSYRC